MKHKIFFNEELTKNYKRKKYSAIEIKLIKFKTPCKNNNTLLAKLLIVNLYQLNNLKKCFQELTAKCNFKIEKEDLISILNARYSQKKYDKQNEVKIFETLKDYKFNYDCVNFSLVTILNHPCYINLLEINKQFSELIHFFGFKFMIFVNKISHIIIEDLNFVRNVKEFKRFLTETKSLKSIKILSLNQVVNNFSKFFVGFALNTSITSFSVVNYISNKNLEELSNMLILNNAIKCVNLKVYKFGMIHELLVYNKTITNLTIKFNTKFNYTDSALYIKEINNQLANYKLKKFTILNDEPNFQFFEFVSTYITLNNMYEELNLLIKFQFNELIELLSLLKSKSNVKIISILLSEFNNYITDKLYLMLKGFKSTFKVLNIHIPYNSSIDNKHFHKINKKSNYKMHLYIQTKPKEIVK